LSSGAAEGAEFQLPHLCAGSALRTPAIRRQRNQHPAFQFLG
jgi:hypothetical protein